MYKLNKTIEYNKNNKCTKPLDVSFDTYSEAKAYMYNDYMVTRLLLPDYQSFYTYKIVEEEEITAKEIETLLDNVVIIHPLEHIKELYMDRNMEKEFSLFINHRISRIFHQRITEFQINEEIATYLSETFNIDKSFFLNLQKSYDKELSIERQKNK